MTVENTVNSLSFQEVLGAISPRGETTRAVVEEVSRGIREGGIKVILSPVLSIWRVGGDLMPTGKATIFLSDRTSRQSLEDQAIDIILEVLPLTRKLSGPELKQMDELESLLRKEANGKG